MANKRSLRTRSWIIMLLLILLLASFAAIWIGTRSASGQTANVYQNGVLICSFDLSEINEAQTYTVETDSGTNVIQIEPGQIRILEADCPDQVCVRAGWLTDRAAPVVCLPHKLVIRLESAPKSAEFDAISG